MVNRAMTPYTGVGDKSRIKIPEASVTEIDAGEDQEGDEQAPSGGARDVSAGRTRHERSITRPICDDANTGIATDRATD
jgi:hypothetical protein